jgi:hypothetical protein
LALQDALRVGERGSVVEGEAYAVGVGGNGEDAVGGALGGAVSDDEEVVVVVDQFVGGGQALTEGFADGADEGLIFRVELFDEGFQLRFRLGRRLSRICGSFCFR